MEQADQHSTVERRKKIIQLLTTKDQIFVDELSNEFNVSEVTIRNDLKQLEAKKLLIRARGGAMSISKTVSFDQQLDEKHKINMNEKNRIGKAAAQLINSNDTVIIDSGTTTLEIVKNLSPTLNQITIITNALNIANINYKML